MKTQKEVTFKSFSWKSRKKKEEHNNTESTPLSLLMNTLKQYRWELITPGRKKYIHEYQWTGSINIVCIILTIFTSVEIDRWSLTKLIKCKYKGNTRMNLAWIGNLHFLSLLSRIIKIKSYYFYFVQYFQTVG